MAPPSDPSDQPARAEDADNADASAPVCVMSFNANDPSGAGGLAADISAMASTGAHVLPVVTGAYSRDTAEIFDHFALDEDAVAEQARSALEDMSVAAIKVGFVGSPETISTIAEIASDYADTPLIAFMPKLSWWEDDQIDSYLDAFRELLLPQTTVLVGNHSTLWRWLLPDWDGDKPPSARDIAKAAAESGVAYTLVTGMPVLGRYLDNALSSPQAVLYSEKFEHFDANFSGTGDTLSAALTALLASGNDLQTATAEALSYLDHSLDAGFAPGMGHLIPDRLFWAQASADDTAPDSDIRPASADHFELPPHGTKQ